MSKPSRKVTRWDGPNKRRARSRKLLLAEQEKSKGRLPEYPAVLSFAGAQAHFERGLIGRGIARARDIVTIQTSRRIGAHDGGIILHKLIKMRDSYLRGMVIWPYTFHSFSKGYRQDRTSIPTFTSASQAPTWYRSLKFRREMHNFIERRPKKFNIIDADLCGIFSEDNATDIVRLMQTGSFAKQGLLFVNHLKGRDGRFGKLFKFLRDYYRYCTHFDADTVRDDEGNELDLNSEDDLSFWFVRYVLVPVFYVCEAFDAGYKLEVIRLVEYRDKNPSTRAGVNMLQWYFRFQRLRSWTLEEKGLVEEAKKAKVSELRSLKEHLDIIRREAYPYTSHLD